jgi:hypothetical protein
VHSTTDSELDYPFWKSNAGVAFGTILVAVEKK